MNAALIFTIIEKGLTVVPLLIQAGTTIIPLIERLRKVAKGGAEGTITTSELEQLEADLDAALDAFNAPLE